MEYKITVISPCYNAENTLKRCVDSIIMQSIGFENIELILYDDGSTDDTRKIIQDYSNKYKNIVPIFSNSNNGPGFGRDLAISKSNGEHIMFIDSDDEYELTICETLLNEINDDIDIVSCNYVFIDEDDYSETIYSSFYKEVKKSVISHDELIYLPSFAVWNKIFKKDIIIKNNIKFTYIKNGEDELFLKHYLLFSKNFVHLGSYVGYKHYDRSHSISNSGTVDDLYNFILVCKKLKEIYEPTGADIPRLLEGRISLLIGFLYLKDILINYDKKLLYVTLNDLADLEEEISFNIDLGLLRNISNFFIKNRHFTFVIIYSKILYYLGKSQFIGKIWGSINQK